VVSLFDAIDNVLVVMSLFDTNDNVVFVIIVVVVVVVVAIAAVISNGNWLRVLVLILRRGRGGDVGLRTFFFVGALRAVLRRCRFHAVATGMEAAVAARPTEQETQRNDRMDAVVIAVVLFFEDVVFGQSLCWCVFVCEQREREQVG